MGNKTIERFKETGVLKVKVENKGKNIRFSEKSHKLLSAYCKKKGYNLGAFCEIGALDKMKAEVINS